MGANAAAVEVAKAAEEGDKVKRSCRKRARAETPGAEKVCVSVCLCVIACLSFFVNMC